MDQGYTVYFDCGTTNTRAYLLDQDLNLKDSLKVSQGARNTAISLDDDFLIGELHSLAHQILTKNQLSMSHVRSYYASGMVTSKFGIKDVDHVLLPISEKEYVNNIYPYEDHKYFNAVINLLPGIKTYHKDVSLVNNLRGEEIELIGALELANQEGLINEAVFLFPGSHTHAIYTRGEKIIGISSNFAGEIFEALKEETILAPILNQDFSKLNYEMVQLGSRNVEKFGFNRAVYISHAMNILKTNDSLEMFSYLEGVINGGIKKSIEYYCKNHWNGCNRLYIVSNSFMGELFKVIFAESDVIKCIDWIDVEQEPVPCLLGITKIIRLKEVE